MAAPNQKLFIPTRPDRGSFPLDHYSLCKRQMMDYMQCLGDHDRDNTKCRALAKDYLACRMENNLMAQEEWSYLGFHESEESKTEVKN